jgi:DNA polymerase-3 subunit delta
MAASIDFDSAYRALKRQAPAPVFYLTGDEELLKEEIVDLILATSVDAASKDFNFDVRMAGELDGESFHSLVETPPMLAERRVVVVKNIELWRKNAKVWQVVHRYLEHPSHSTVLVITHGCDQKPMREIAKHSVHVALEPLNHRRQLRWIKVRAERAGFELADDAAEHLLKVVGGNLSLLAAEVDKVAAITAEGESIGASEIADLVGVRHGETHHDWIEAVLMRDTLRAATILPIVMANSGVSGVRLTATLGTGLIGVRLARAYLDDGDSPGRIEGTIRRAVRRAKIEWMFRDTKDPFAVWARAAGQWTTREIDDALRAAYECDKALKSTTISDERGTITELLLKMSRIEVAA